MTLDQARKICEEIIQKCGSEIHSDYHEERKGEMVFANLTLKFRINSGSPKKLIDKKQTI